MLPYTPRSEGEIHTFAQELMQKGPNPDCCRWSPSCMRCLRLVLLLSSCPCEKKTKPNKPPTKRTNPTGGIFKMCGHASLLLCVGSYDTDNKQVAKLHPSNGQSLSPWINQTLFLHFREKQANKKAKAVHFTVVLFGGWYRQKDWPDTGSWGGPGSVSWL